MEHYKTFHLYIVFDGNLKLMIPFFVTVDTQLSTYSYGLVAEELILFVQYIYLGKKHY